MPNLEEDITDIVVGDDYDIERTITSIPTGQILSKGWLTIKERASDADVDAIIQKEITSVAVNGTGHIDDTGADETGHVIFQLVPADTLLLTPHRRYHFDIQVKTDAGKIYTPFKGAVRFVNQITVASS